ncbi:MAG: lysostaphin resistance A-like protein [Acetatifactor sp.]
MEEREIIPEDTAVVKETKKATVEDLILIKKHFSKLGWAYLAATLIIDFVQIVAVAVLKSVNPHLLNSIEVNLLISVVSMYAIGFPLMFFILKKSVPAQKLERHRMSPGQFILALIICFGLTYASNIIGLILTSIIGKVSGHNIQNQASVVLTGLNPWLLILYVVIFGPIMEELVFRKLIVDRTVRYGQGVAVVVSGLMFGLFHGNLNQFAYAVVIGMFLAFLYVKTGNLKITISIHILINFVGGFLIQKLFDMVNMEEYEQSLMAGDYAMMMDDIVGNLAGWVLLGLFCCIVIAVLVSGVVLFIVAVVQKKFRFEKGEVDIPKQLRTNIILANSGMFVFLLVWTVMIVIQMMS